MFSVKEKQEIAEKIEKILLDLKHPEMPTERPLFALKVIGKEEWSWADILPNWTFSEENPPKINPWNEKAREVLAKSQEEEPRHTVSEDEEEDDATGGFGGLGFGGGSEGFGGGASGGAGAGRGF